MPPSNPTPPELDGKSAQGGTHLVGGLLRARRKALSLTLDAVAAQAGIATGFLSEIERDRSSPSVASLIRLRDVLVIPVESLFTSSQAQLVRADAREPMAFGGDPAMPLSPLTFGPGDSFFIQAGSRVSIRYRSSVRVVFCSVLPAAAA